MFGLKPDKMNDPDNPGKKVEWFKLIVYVPRVAAVQHM